MTETQEKFVKLSERYEELRNNTKIVKEELTKLMTEIGVGAYFQDEDTKIVYNIQVPTGTFINFDKVTYIRTKKDGEFKGSLSKKEAEEKGFIL